jgi:hypothetical protein
MVFCSKGYSRSFTTQIIRKEQKKKILDRRYTFVFLLLMVTKLFNYAKKIYVRINLSLINPVMSNESLKKR